MDDLGVGHVSDHVSTIDETPGEFDLLVRVEELVEVAADIEERLPTNRTGTAEEHGDRPGPVRPARARAGDVTAQGVTLLVDDTECRDCTVRPACELATDASCRSRSKGGVVVEEADDLAASGIDAGVSPTGHADVLVQCDDVDTGVDRSVAAAPVLDEDHLVHRVVVEHGSDRPPDVVGTIPHRQDHPLHRFVVDHRGDRTPDGRRWGRTGNRGTRDRARRRWRRVAVPSGQAPTKRMLRAVLHRFRAPFGVARRFVVDRLPPPDPGTTGPRRPATQRRSRLVAHGRMAVAWLLRHLERPEACLDQAVRACDADPTFEPALELAVTAALHAGTRGIVRVANVGLLEEPSGDPDLAVELAQRAAEFSPDSTIVATQLARAFRSAGRVDDAEDVLRTLPESEPVARETAALLQLRGRTRGGLSVAESDQLIAAWRTVLQAAPRDHVIRSRLVRHLVWLGDYGTARLAAWPDHEAADSAEITDRAPIDWLFAVHAEKLAAGDLAGSVAAKTTIAEQLSEVPAPTAPAWRFVESLRALSYLGRPDEARSHAAARLETRLRPIDRLAIEKLAADLALAAGDPEPIRSIRARLATPTPAAEQRFAAEVADASVLVVGPAPDAQPTPTDLAAADVVVYTKRPRTLDAGHDVVVYPSDSSALLEATTEPSGGVDLVVLRPSIVGLPGVEISGHGAVRVMQCEDSNAFLGTRLGIPRIVYDLLAYRPRRLVLSGIDFFLGPVTYVEGYANEIEDIYRPQGLAEARSFAPHDPLFDHAFLRDLHRCGLVEAIPTVAALLDDPGHADRLATRLRDAAEAGEWHPILGQVHGGAAPRR